jgi:predicted Zn-dependent protease
VARRRKDAALGPQASDRPGPSDPALSHRAEGERLFAAGRSREAKALLAEAVALDPGLAGAWRLLGDIELIGGDARAAQAAYDRMLRAVVPDARLREPTLALAEGRLMDAERQLRQLLAREPSNPVAGHVLGEVLARQGRVAAAEGVLAHVVGRAPGLNLARQALALALQRGGKHAEAVVQLDLLLARDPRNLRARMAKAASLAEIGDFAAAADATAEVTAAFPDQPRGWMILGNTLRTLGRVEAAEAAFRRCLDLDPDCAEAWWSLANLKAYRFAAADIAAIEARRTAPRLDPDARSLLAFALAKAREDAGDDAAAFALYAEANELQRSLRPYDAESAHAYVQRAKALFTPAFFAARAGWGEAAADPIFIVGLPRSGSTLVEQILASHTAVEGTRELMDVQQMADWVALQGAAPYPGPLAALPREAFSQLGRDYLDRTRPHRRLGRARFIDKAPWNWLHVGLIQLMLPGARIIDVRRHPLGCGLSAFKQHFAGGFDFAYDLADIGRYYADYVDLMAHFDAVSPGRVVRVIYEDLVADTETQVRRLLDDLSLPFDPATLRFFENRRAVATPSSEQVRRPIFGEAVDHWRRFEPWLGPLKSALGPVLDAYPSAPGAGS